MEKSVTQRFINFSKPFIEGCRGVFTTMIATDIKPNSPKIKTEQGPQGDISSLLGISGTHEGDGGTNEYRGMIVLSYPMDTYLKVASAMLMEEYTEFNEEIADVGGEIVNIIVGNAKRSLGEMGYTSSMAIPSIIRGKEHSISYPDGTTIISIPIDCDHGPFFLEVAYTEITKKD